MKKYIHKLLLLLFLYNSPLQTSAKIIPNHAPQKPETSSWLQMYCCCFTKTNRIADSQQAFRKYALKKETAVPQTLLHRTWLLPTTPKKTATTSAKNAQKLATKVADDLEKTPNSPKSLRTTKKSQKSFYLVSNFDNIETI